MYLASIGFEFHRASGIPGFSAFMSIWAIVMLEYWKRKEAAAAMVWGMTSFEEEETTRPEYKQVRAPPFPLYAHAPLTTTPLR